MNILWKRSDRLPFSRKSYRKKEKSTVSFTHVQNIICSQTQLDGIAHEQTIICSQLFAGHVVGSRPMKKKKNLLQMIINNYNTFLLFYSPKPRSQAWILIYRNWSKRNIRYILMFPWQDFCYEFFFTFCFDPNITICQSRNVIFARKRP